MTDTAKFQFNKKDILFILIIFIVAIALRVIYFNLYRDTNIFPILQASDSESYYFWAKDIASGDIWGNKAFMKWPFYAYWLALIFKAFGTNLASVYSLQFVLGGINCILIYLIAKKLFDRNIGLLAGLFSACYGLFIFYEGLLVYTSISLFLNSILFLWILYLKDSLSAKKLFCIGIFLGICVITQGNILIFGVLAMAWVLGNSKLEFKKKFYNFIIFLAGMSIIIGCVTLRNYLVEKDPVLITGNLGINFYLGNNPEATGTFFCPADITMNQDDMFRDAKIIAESELKRRLLTSEVSSYWFNKTWSFIRQEPVRFVKLLMNKFIYIFIPREIVHDIEFSFIAEKLRFLKFNFLLLKFILPFGLLGMLLGLKNFHKNALLYIILFGLSVGIAIFFVTARYRVMMVPYLLIFASFGIFSIWNTLRQKRYNSFCALILAVILIFQLLNYASVYANQNIDSLKNNLSIYEYHLNRASAFERNLNFQQSIKELNEASQLDPRNRRAIFKLGIIYCKTYDFKSAEEKFKEVINISPNCFDAYYNLGYIYNQEMRFQEAKQMLEKATSLDAQDFRAHFELAMAKKSTGDIEGTKKELLLALKNVNRWRKVDREIIEKELSILGK